MVARSNSNSHAAGPLPVVAEHRLVRRIGVGAYGEVWLARSVTGMPRAVKVIRRDRFEHERIYEREFTGLKNFEPISRLHPGVVDVLQVGRCESQGYFYYVMELADPVGPVDGEPPDAYEPLTLETLLRAGGALPVGECARMGAAVADALGFLHARDLVHRDVKPSNIILVAGQPKLADIGLVAGLGEAQSFVGTEGYIPPEGPGSPRSDLFSLGKVLYEMATGRNRLDFPDLPTAWQHADEIELFAELNETILRACASVPADRHESAEELRNELLLVEAGRSVRRLRRNDRILARWRRFGVVVAAVGLASLVVASLARDAMVRADRRASAEIALRERIEAEELRTRQTLYAADMNLAQQAIAVGNFGRAETLLAAYLPAGQADELRGFEWFHFWDRVRGDTQGVLHGHEQVISSLQLSRDGRRLYSASFDGTLREWSVDDLQERRRWSWPGRILLALALDPNRERIALELDNPPTLLFLDLSTGASTTNRSAGSPSLAYSPEGDRLLRGRSMVLFETNAVTEILTLEPHAVEQVLDQSGGRAWFAPGGNLLVTGPWGNALRLWSWPGLEPLGDLSGAGTVMAASFSPDGSRLVSASRQGRLQLWDLGTGLRRFDRLTHEESVIWSVAYSPDGTRVASGGNDQTVRLWDAATLEERHVFRGHSSEVWVVRWAPDGRQLISAGKDGTIRFWDTEPDIVAFERTNVAQAPVFSPDDRLMAVRLVSSGITVLDPATGHDQLDLGPALELGGFSNDGRSLSLLRADGRVEQRALADGRLLESHPVPLDPGPITIRLLSASGRWLVTGTETGLIHVYPVPSGEPARELTGHSQRIFSLELCPDERQLLSGSRDLSARLWDLESGRELATFLGHRMSVSALAFSADGSRIATGSWDDTVRLWDAATGSSGPVYGAHSASVHAVAFAPDHRTLAVLSGGAELRFWNLSTGREAGAFQLDRGTGLGRLRFSPQGRWLAAVNPAGRLTLLPAPRSESHGQAEFR